MKKLIAIALLCASVSICCGCASVTGRALGTTWGSPYAGTMLAIAYSDMEPILWADVPFEVVLDTAFLPVDLLLLPVCR